MGCERSVRVSPGLFRCLFEGKGLAGIWRVDIVKPTGNHMPSRETLKGHSSIKTSTLLMCPYRKGNCFTKLFDSGEHSLLSTHFSPYIATVASNAANRLHRLCKLRMSLCRVLLLSQCAAALLRCKCRVAQRWTSPLARLDAKPPIARAHTNAVVCRTIFNGRRDDLSRSCAHRDDQVSVVSLDYVESSLCSQCFRDLFTRICIISRIIQRLPSVGTDNDIHRSSHARSSQAALCFCLSRQLEPSAQGLERTRRRAEHRS